MNHAASPLHLWVFRLSESFSDGDRSPARPILRLFSRNRCVKLDAPEKNRERYGTARLLSLDLVPYTASLRHLNIANVIVPVNAHFSPS